MREVTVMNVITLKVNVFIKTADITMIVIIDISIIIFIVINYLKNNAQMNSSI